MPASQNHTVTEEHILAVLAGNSLSTVASNARVEPTVLADAVATYRNAGRAALDAAHAESTNWHQVNVAFPDWHQAEHVVATHLLPVLRQLETDGPASCWWYIRKAPHWRLRLHPADRQTRNVVDRTLDRLAGRGSVTAWRHGIYEPETAVFGGTGAMHIAHRLFHADSTAILDSTTTRPTGAHLGRPELSVLRCAALLRCAGLDWHEQGDVWHRVALLRPLPDDIPAERVQRLSTAAHRLLATDTTAIPGLLVGEHGLHAFARAGRDLEHAAQRGELQRGIRDVLAHHVIFHWNRLGLPDRTQATLAHAARRAILDA